MSAVLLKFGFITALLKGDVAFFIVAFLILFGLAFYFGKGFVVSLIVSYYPASLLYKAFPFIDKLLFLKTANGLVLNKIGIFLLFFTPIVIIVNRFVFTASDYGGGEGLVRLSGLTIALLIIIVIFSYDIASYDFLHNFSPKIDDIFAASEGQFYWNLGIFALLAIL